MFPDDGYISPARLTFGGEMVSEAEGMHISMKKDGGADR